MKMIWKLNQNQFQVIKSKLPRKKLIKIQAQLYCVSTKHVTVVKCPICWYISMFALSINSLSKHKCDSLLRRTVSIWRPTLNSLSTGGWPNMRFKWFVIANVYEKSKLSYAVQCNYVSLNNCNYYLLRRRQLRQLIHVFTIVSNKAII